jgi:hypothetical protein
MSGAAHFRSWHFSDIARRQLLATHSHRHRQAAARCRLRLAARTTDCVNNPTQKDGTITGCIGGVCIFGRIALATGPQQIFYVHNTQIIGNPMPRPRKPTAMLELSGAFKRNPKRKKERQHEPLVTTPLPSPPNYLTSTTAATWREMKRYGYWLTSPDRFLVEIASTFVARYRVEELKSGDVSLLIGLLGKLGFSPRERGALNLPTETT